MAPISVLLALLEKSGTITSINYVCMFLPHIGIAVDAFTYILLSKTYRDNIIRPFINRTPANPVEERRRPAVIPFSNEGV